MAERKGIVFVNGKPLTLIGNEVKVGDTAPDFQALDNGMNKVSLANFKGKNLILSSVSSLDTQVCDLETKRFNDEARGLGKDVAIATVSMDLPFAQKRWADEANVKDVSIISDHKDASFGMNYGVLVKETRLLARTVFVIDKQGKVRYIQYVKEIPQEPDYDDVLEAVKKL